MSSGSADVNCLLVLSPSWCQLLLHLHFKLLSHVIITVVVIATVAIISKSLGRLPW